MSSIVAQIVKGPSKFDLMLALFDSTHDKPRRVEFVLANGDKFCAYIHTVGAEDGSGDSWNIIASGLLVPLAAKIQEVKGYYNTARRTGTLSFGQ